MKQFIESFTQMLAQDVSLVGELTSPMLSWIGAGGLILFFLWQVCRLQLSAARTSRPFHDIHPLLEDMAGQVESRDVRQSFERAVGEPRDTRRTTSPDKAGPTDLDRLTSLDRAMRDSEAFSRPWIRFRKTLLIERVAWFQEPRIYSTKCAEDLFTQEAVLGMHMDVGFFEQVPALLTGIGLVFTFVAICVGLSRLHADGQTISGVQGLINGLAGKFVTSIVGLVCANLFTLIQKPVFRRLSALHAEFLSLIDQSFPRRTVENLLDEMAEGNRGRSSAGNGTAAVGANLDRVLHTLTESLEAVTSTMQQMAARSQELPGTLLAGLRRELEQAIQAGTQGQSRELRAAVRALTAATEALTAKAPAAQDALAAPEAGQPRSRRLFSWGAAGLERTSA